MLQASENQNPGTLVADNQDIAGDRSSLDRPIMALSSTVLETASQRRLRIWYPKNSWCLKKSRGQNTSCWGVYPIPNQLSGFPFESAWREVRGGPGAFYDIGGWSRGMIYDIGFNHTNGFGWDMN